MSDNGTIGIRNEANSEYEETDGFLRDSRSFGDPNITFTWNASLIASLYHRLSSPSGIECDKVVKTIQLISINFSFQVFQHKVKIAEISSHASNEYALEQMLRKVCILRKYLVFP